MFKTDAIDAAAAYRLQRAGVHFAGDSFGGPDLSWHTTAQAWLAREAAREHKAQFHAHKKRRRSTRTYRYVPPTWQRDAIEALGRNDEEQFKEAMARSAFGRIPAGLNLPPQWGVPPAGMVRPGEVPEGWDPNLFGCATCEGGFGALTSNVSFNKTADPSFIDSSKGSPFNKTLPGFTDANVPVSPAVVPQAIPQTRGGRWFVTPGGQDVWRITLPAPNPGHAREAARRILSREVGFSVPRKGGWRFIVRPVSFTSYYYPGGLAPAGTSQPSLSIPSQSLSKPSFIPSQSLSKPSFIPSQSLSKPSFIPSQSSARFGTTAMVGGYRISKRVYQVNVIPPTQPQPQAQAYADEYAEERLRRNTARLLADEFSGDVFGGADMDQDKSWSVRDANSLTEITGVEGVGPDFGTEATNLDFGGGMT